MNDYKNNNAPRQLTPEEIAKIPAGKRLWMSGNLARRCPNKNGLPPKVGPNEPCPCGSGRKNKRCHNVRDTGMLAITKKEEGAK